MRRALPDPAHWVDRKPGAMKIIAWELYLYGPGVIFTTAEAEDWVAKRLGSKRVETDRRIRDLRSHGWVINEHRDNRLLRQDQRELVRVGQHVWDERWHAQQATGCPADIRRAVLERDDNRCQICGISAGEEYPEMPGTRARLTVGRRLPGASGGGYTLGNSRAECSRCNENVRVSYYDPLRAPCPDCSGTGSCSSCNGTGAQR